MKTQVTIQGIKDAKNRLGNVVKQTPLIKHAQLSSDYEANIYLKHENEQDVHSYKIRGAYNKIAQLSDEEKSRGIVCASAGNHAQGVALSSKIFGVKAVIFMPINTPTIKINKVKIHDKNGDFIELKLVGNTYDEAKDAALSYCIANKMVFVHPFDDIDIIEGQATIGIELLEQQAEIDYLFVPVGGGGLAAGLSTWFKHSSPRTIIVGVEPTGAPSLITALNAKKAKAIEIKDTFIDGAAVAKVGETNFNILQSTIDNVEVISENKTCQTLLYLYDTKIIVEPAGAMSVAILDAYREKIKGKNIVCILSGGNNDYKRFPEIIERASEYEGLNNTLEFGINVSRNFIENSLAVFLPLNFEWSDSVSGKDRLSLKMKTLKNLYLFLHFLIVESIDFEVISNSKRQYPNPVKPYRRKREIKMV